MPSTCRRLFAAPLRQTLIVPLLAFTGCFYYPSLSYLQPRPTADDAFDRPAKITDHVRLNATTRQELIAFLGQPIASEDPTQLYYTWTVLNGFFIFPIWLQVVPLHKFVTLQLQFDDHDRLVGYALRGGSSPRRYRDGQLYDPPEETFVKQGKVGPRLGRVEPPSEPAPAKP